MQSVSQQPADFRPYQPAYYRIERTSPFKLSIGMQGVYGLAAPTHALLPPLAKKPPHVLCSFPLTDDVLRAANFPQVDWPGLIRSLWAPWSVSPSAGQRPSALFRMSLALLLFAPLSAACHTHKAGAAVALRDMACYLNRAPAPVPAAQVRLPLLAHSRRARGGRLEPHAGRGYLRGVALHARLPTSEAEHAPLAHAMSEQPRPRASHGGSGHRRGDPRVSR